MPQLSHEQRQRLFNYFAEAHDLLLLEDDFRMIDDLICSQHDGKPIVSGSVPKFDADGFKRWMSGWVEPKHIPTIAAYVEKMLGGNDR